MTVGIILYGNPDYYPPIINAVWILKKQYKVVIFSKNVSNVIHSYGSNTTCYRFGNNISTIESERKNPFYKLIEYFLFIIKSVFYFNRHKCKIIIAYDPFALVTATLLKIFNSKINLFYHENEMTTLIKKNKFSLSDLIYKLAHQNLNRCSWISQSDIKRAEAFNAYFKNRFDVHLIRNFALSDYKYNKTSNDLYEKYKKKDYITIGYIGTIGENFYIEELLKFVIATNKKIALFLAGNIRSNILKEKISNINNDSKPGKVIYLHYLSQEEKYILLNNIDCGLVLYKPVKDSITYIGAGACTKVGEYVAFGLPIIYPEWWDYEPYYKEIGLSYSNNKELIERIEQMSSNQELRKQYSSNAKRLFKERLNFEFEFKEMKDKIDSCMNL